MFNGDRPACPKACPGRVHRHGSYERFARPTGCERVAVQRFLCPECGLTLSVLRPQQLPYRSVAAPRLEAFFNEQAEAGTGPDPPPDELEAGCLQRAWRRFQTRVQPLKNAFGLMIASASLGPGHLWKQMRLAKGNVHGILLYLARFHKCSLLGDYRCLRVPG
jgi:hypothetical protein